MGARSSVYGEMVKSFRMHGQLGQQGQLEDAAAGQDSAGDDTILHTVAYEAQLLPTSTRPAKRQAKQSGQHGQAAKRMVRDWLPAQ